jgi:hypothetical protein
MTPERAIVKAILAYLNDLPHGLARKRWGGGMGVAGDPDIDACVGGRCVQFEVKRPGQNPTALQLTRLEEWRKAGAVVGVVRSVEDARQILEHHLPHLRADGGEQKNTLPLRIPDAECS